MTLVGETLIGNRSRYVKALDNGTRPFKKVSVQGGADRSHYIHDLEARTRRVVSLHDEDLGETG